MGKPGHNRQDRAVGRSSSVTHDRRGRRRGPRPEDLDLLNFEMDEDTRRELESGGYEVLGQSYDEDDDDDDDDDDDEEEEEEEEDEEDEDDDDDDDEEIQDLKQLVRLPGGLDLAVESGRIEVPTGVEGLYNQESEEESDSRSREMEREQVSPGPGQEHSGPSQISMPKEDYTPPERHTSKGESLERGHSRLEPRVASTEESLRTETLSRQVDLGQTSRQSERTDEYVEYTDNGHSFHETNPEHSTDDDGEFQYQHQVLEYDSESHSESSPSVGTIAGSVVGTVGGVSAIGTGIVLAKHTYLVIPVIKALI